MQRILIFALLLSLINTSFANEILAKLTTWQVRLNKEHIVEHLYDDVYLLDFAQHQLKTLKNRVVYGEPNYRYYPLSRVDDPLYKKQWALHPIKSFLGKTKASINIEAAWNIFSGRKDIVIAIIDSGLDINHPDLRNNLWVNQQELNGVDGVDDDGNGYVDDIYGYDFRNDRPLLEDDYGHGTHCAGVIGAEHNEIGIAGIMPHVKLMGLKFFSANGGTNADAIKAIRYAVDNGAQIISNSWGGYDNSALLKEAIAYAQSKGVLFVAAAGNDGTDNDKHPLYPASYDLDNIISVGAITSKGKKWSFSNYGKQSVDIFAPGKKIISTVPYEMYEKMSGTSMATPQVAGVAGLLLAQNSHLSFREIKNILVDSAKHSSALNGKAQANGYLDAYAALQIINQE